MKYCQKCGASMQDEDVFCQYCGEKSTVPVNFAPQPAQYPYTQYPYVKRKVNPLAIILPVAAVVIVAIVLLIVFLPGAGSPIAVAERYLDALSKGDMDAMVNCLDPDTAAMVKNFANTDDLARYFTGLKNQGDTQYRIEYSVLNEQVSGDTAKVTADITVYIIGQNKQTEQITIPLKKINGKWYVTITGY